MTDTPTSTTETPATPEKAKSGVFATITQYVPYGLLLLAIGSVYIENIKLKDHVELLQMQYDAIAHQVDASPTVKVVDDMDVVDFFTTEGYDQKTQLEYVELIKKILDANHIVVVNKNSVNFAPTFPKLNLPPITALRGMAKQLKIANPLDTDPHFFDVRIEAQNKIRDKMLSQMK